VRSQQDGRQPVVDEVVTDGRAGKSGRLGRRLDHAITFLAAPARAGGSGPQHAATGAAAPALGAVAALAALVVATGRLVTDAGSARAPAWYYVFVPLLLLGVLAVLATGVAVANRARKLPAESGPTEVWDPQLTELIRFADSEQTIHISTVDGGRFSTEDER
jgi:hypothetical protein